MKHGTSWKMGHVGSKIKSQGQILEKPCVHSRGHIFSPIIIKLCHNLCRDEISDEVKRWVMLGKNLGHKVKS